MAQVEDCVAALANLTRAVVATPINSHVSGSGFTLVLGGDDVNTPGTKHAEVFYC